MAQVQQQGVPRKSNITLVKNPIHKGFQHLSKIEACFSFLVFNFHILIHIYNQTIDKSFLPAQSFHKSK